MSKRDLTNRVIVITGASAGIGRAAAIACARAGMDVVIAARRIDRLESLAREIESLGRRALPVCCDVANRGDNEALIDQAMVQFGRLDAALANAGFAFEAGVADMSERDLREIFEVNFFGTMSTLRAALPVMRRQRSGHLLITSSCLARLAPPYYSAYSATKAAQAHVGRALGLELAPEGIDVSTIFPIRTTTELFDVSARRSGRSSARTLKRGPFVQSPERVADAIVQCLRRPRPEVWTSHTIRFAAALITMFPAAGDFALNRRASQRKRARSK